MAKKAETVNMVDQFAEFKELKNIDKPTLISVLEESFRNVLAKMFGSDENFDVIMNPDKGDCEIYQNLEVVADGEVENKDMQIGLTEAREIDPECEIGEDVAKQIYFEKFGRRAILTLRQTLQAKLLDLHKDAVYSKFKEIEGEVITAEVHQVWGREALLVDEDQNELVLPRDEQIPGQRLFKGDTVRALVKRVDNPNNNPKVIVSRTDPRFLRRLFEMEVPEVHDGLITIKDVARRPGERAKVSVESYDERIDPVGACVGVKGSRIHGIVRELHNENIDVLSYTSNPQLYIQRALSPAVISSMRIDEEKKKAEVYLAPEEVSLAIGKGGSNIDLAQKLTGYSIDVFRLLAEDEVDVMLDEFKDVIDDWVIETFKNLGLVTAKNVLNAPKELIDQADLEDETVEHVMEVLRAEFEN
ncbi:MAG: transcription termination factor NusA [Muribaculaceae bacterium]|nr:transcription termination factor NusA [Muribaculaceae bacterium]